jgi:hypothetical protein
MPVGLFERPDLLGKQAAQPLAAVRPDFGSFTKSVKTGDSDLLARGRKHGIMRGTILPT